jgi:hypothetical protein
MKTAVDTILVGKERTYNRRFLQMCGPYPNPRLEEALAHESDLVLHLTRRPACRRRDPPVSKRPA